MEEQLNDIFTFLSNDTRPDLQIITLENFLAITGTSDGVSLICQSSKLLILLISLLENVNSGIAKQSSLMLVNISACEKGPEALLHLSDALKESNSSQQPLHNTNPVIKILKHVLEPNSDIADPCCMVLSNISRPMQFIETLVDIILKSDITFDQIINVLTKNKYNNKGQNLYYLGPLLSNLSQSSTMRKYILDKNKCIIQRLLPFTEYDLSVIKRGGIVGTVRNCCFETEYHSWLLSDDVDILPSLLLPVAGNTEYDEEDNEKLPLQLQYLSDNKIRENDPDIRCMLLEAITQLCALRENREYIRRKNTYVILRELHKWETDKKALLACHNLVDILIRTEEEIGEDNLREIEVPQNLQNQFEQMDQDCLR